MCWCQALLFCLTIPTELKCTDALLRRVKCTATIPSCPVTWLSCSIPCCHSGPCTPLVTLSPLPSPASPTISLWSPTHLYLAAQVPLGPTHLPLGPTQLPLLLTHLPVPHTSDGHTSSGATSFCAWTVVPSCKQVMCWFAGAQGCSEQHQDEGQQWGGVCDRQQRWQLHHLGPDHLPPPQQPLCQHPLQGRAVPPR